jgi:hypothetical protein
MPVLDNPRHERFAQELAKGATQNDAYYAAGFKAHDGNAARLSGNERVTARVAELLGRVATKTELTVASISDRLLDIARKAEALRDAPGLSVARAAMMDAAKLNGLVIDRAINENWHHDVSNSPPSEDEWTEAHSTH